MTFLKIKLDDTVHKNLEQVCKIRRAEKDTVIRHLIVDHLDRNTPTNLSTRIKKAEFKSLRLMINDEEIG